MRRQSLKLVLVAAGAISLLVAQTKIQLETQATVTGAAPSIVVWIPGTGIRVAELGSGISLSTAAPYIVTVSGAGAWVREAMQPNTPTDYSISAAPARGSLHIFLNGLLQTEGDDYVELSPTLYRFMLPVTGQVQASYQAVAP